MQFNSYTYATGVYYNMNKLNRLQGCDSKLL